MEYIVPKETIRQILCCDCGVGIEPNPTNQCIGCVRAKNDISEDIPKSAVICFCRGCDRYLDPPSTWIKASLESRELLALCLKIIKGLDTVRLVDAGFIWTEPHCKRIKVKLSVQKEIKVGAALQQEVVIEFVVQWFFCEDCHRVEAQDFWNACVQIRQKAEHKRTSFFLEQVILKHKAHLQAINITPHDTGLDFFFATDTAASKFMSFLTSVIICRWNKAKELKSHDIRSNIFHYKFTYCVDLPPVCRGNVVCLSRELSKKLASIGRLCIVQKISTTIFLVNPQTAQMAEVNGNLFKQMPFNTVGTDKKLIQYTVIDMSKCRNKDMKNAHLLSKKHELAEVWLQRTEDLGVGEEVFCRSHLGAEIQIGDVFMGFEAANCNINDENFEEFQMDVEKGLVQMPDVILVKKFKVKVRYNRKKVLKLKRLKINTDTDAGSEFNQFEAEVADDPELRAQVEFYEETINEEPDQAFLDEIKGKQIKLAKIKNNQSEDVMNKNEKESEKEDKWEEVEQKRIIGGKEEFVDCKSVEKSVKSPSKQEKSVKSPSKQEKSEDIPSGKQEKSVDIPSSSKIQEQSVRFAEAGTSQTEKSQIRKDKNSKYIELNVKGLAESLKFEIVTDKSSKNTKTKKSKNPIEIEIPDQEFKVKKESKKLKKSTENSETSKKSIDNSKTSKKSVSEMLEDLNVENSDDEWETDED